MELSIILVVVALICWLNYYLANQRGRSEIGWVIGGLIFGLFSTLLLLVIGTTEEKRTEDAIKLHKALNK